MFETFQDMQDFTEEDMRKVEMCRRWCIAGVMGSFLYLQYIFTWCALTFVST